MSPSTVNYVIRAIAVLEHELIDRLCPVVKLIDQRLAEIIVEWSTRMTGARDSDTTNLLIVLNIICPKEQVVPATLLDDRRSPECPFDPWRISVGKNTGVFCPGDQVS